MPKNLLWRGLLNLSRNLEFQMNLPVSRNPSHGLKRYVLTLYVDFFPFTFRTIQQIYNWFKNTVGRARRKQEGRSRQDKKTPEG